MFIQRPLLRPHHIILGFVLLVVAVVTVVVITNPYDNFLTNFIMEKIDPTSVRRHQNSANSAQEYTPQECHSDADCIRIAYVNNRCDEINTAPINKAEYEADKKKGPVGPECPRRMACERGWDHDPDVRVAPPLSPGCFSEPRCIMQGGIFGKKICVLYRVDNYK